MKKQPIYLLSHKLKWPFFKELQDKLVKDSGPTPDHGDKVLWQLLREKRIYCWFDDGALNDMKIGSELPKNRQIRLVVN